MISYDNSLTGKKIPRSILKELSYSKVVEGIRLYYNSYLVAQGKRSHEILVNLPYRVYYFGARAGDDFSSVIVFGSDEATGATKYGLWLGWGSKLMTLFPPKIQRSMWEQTGVRPWNLVDFETALRAGFTSQHYTADEFFSWGEYAVLRKSLGDAICMETFYSIISDSGMPFDVEAYNREVDSMGLPYVDEATLRMVLPSIVGEIEDRLERDGMFEHQTF